MEFDGWSVDRISGEISRDGHSSRLPQQPLRILIELFDHAGTIVTREQLVKALWPAGVVDFDNGLNVAMRKLRVALDDVGDTPRYIETLPRVGYRFIAPKSALATAAAGAVSTKAHGIFRHGGRALWLAVLALGIGVVAAWWLGVVDKPSRHVPSERAQELYLEGIHERSRRDTNAIRAAIEKFEAALAEDPDYAEAWAMYGLSLTSAVVRQMIPPAEGIPKARAAADRAIALDPGLVDAYVVRVHIEMDHDKNFAAATRDLEHARQFGGNSALFWHYSAMWNAEQGRIDQGLADMRRARELEPMTLLLSSNYAFILYNARRYDETIAFLKPLVDANPGFDHARSVLARALTATGDFAGALAQLQARSGPNANQGELGVLYAKMGRRDDARREIARLESLEKQGFAESYEMATIHAALGELATACEQLGRALEDRSLLINWMRTDPRMDALRGRQCFAEVEKKLFK